MTRAIIRQNRLDASLPRPALTPRAPHLLRLGAAVCLAAVFVLAPLSSALAQRVIIAPSYSSNSGWSYSSSSSAYSSYYNSTRQSPDTSCAYYGSHGSHAADCGCGYNSGAYDGYYGNSWGRQYGRRDLADTYYQRRRLEEIERRVNKLKREEDRERERDARAARLEQERRERMDRIALLRADPEASAPKVYGSTNASAEGAVTAYFAYHQQREARLIGVSGAYGAGGSSAAQAKPGPAPAAGYTAVGAGDWTYYYKDGQFFNLEGEALTPIAAPVGALVFALPAERRLAAAGERPIYECRGAFFQLTFFGSKQMYEVVPPPNALADAATY